VTRIEPGPDDLRRRAERRLAAAATTADALRSPTEIERLLHELQVHQIELEMQNDELRYVRDQAESLLARYTELYDFAPTGYASFDAEGNVLRINLMGSRLLGAERSALNHRPFALFLMAEHRRDFDDLLHRAFGGEAAPWCEVSPRGDASAVIRVEGTLAADTKEFRAVLQDVTESRKALDVARLHSAALHAAASAMFITDVTGKIEWVNAAFTALTGYSEGEAVGRTTRDLLWSGVHEPAVFKKLWETVLAGRVWRGELTNRRKDGTHYLEERVITPFADARGKLVHFIAMGCDLTEQRLLEAQALQSHKMETVGRLAGGIAHDFNNLLTVINGTVELALLDVPPEEPLHRDLEEVRSAGARAAQLTRQLLAFSRKQVLKLDELHLGGLVLGIKDMLGRLLGERVVLDIAVRDDAGMVRADAVQIEQVILNLSVNARDAMPEGGTLAIATDSVQIDARFATLHPTLREGAYVRLTIRDTGIGMDEELRVRAFEPFFTTKAVGTGTGLGLAMVYGIVTQSGGTVLVDSEVGKGTTFSIYLPRVVAKPIALEAAPRPIRERGNETILVVEDEDAVRRVAERVLRQAGYTVLSATGGHAALDLLSTYTEPVHLLLSDIVMPGMDGSELAAALTQLRPAMRVLFLSGYADEERLYDPRLGRNAAFIGKPYTPAQLTSQVREVLDA